MKRASRRVPPSNNGFLARLKNTPFEAPLLAAIAFAAYANSLRGEFVFDDRNVIFLNPHLLNLKTFGQIFQVSGWRQPLSVSYGLNYYFGGLDPFGYHLLNVALHALNAIVVFYILLKLGAGRRAGFAGAALFAVHPLLTGAVDYIAGRSSLLCGTFYFLAFLAFLKGLEMQRWAHRLIWFGTALGAFALAFATKEEGIALAGLIAAWLWIRSQKRNWVYLAIPLAIGVVAAFLAWKEFAPGFAALSANEDLVRAGYDPVPPLPTYLRTYVTAVVEDVFPNFVWPTHLNVDHDVKVVADWWSPEFVLALGIVLGLTGAVLFLKNRRWLLLRAGIAGILVSPLAAHALVPEADVIQEHRVYIAGLGFAIASAWAAEWALRRFGARSLAVFVGVAIIFGVMTANRNHVWASDTMLWEDAASKSPLKTRPHLNLGSAYENAGRLSDALREYETAVRLKPRLWAVHRSIASIVLQQGNLERAREILENLRASAPSFADGWNLLGLVYMDLGRPDDALKVLNEALALRPDSDYALLLRGQAFAYKEQFTEAISDYKAALAIRSDLALLRFRLGAAYMHVGNNKEAEEQFRFLADDPKSAADANRNLGVLRSNAGDYDAAVTYFNKALFQRPVFPEVHHDLGIVFLRKGDPTRAIEEFRSSLAQRPDFGPAVLSLGEVLVQAGRKAEARDTLQQYTVQFANQDSAYVREARRRLETWQ
jgi:tetratricopeptide (TPR) repeat protein